ncbi:MAG: trimethylamine methyltransferase family protein [Gemmatimonadota bacterium]|nr:trimethylamine methyltransferase family protein [Gemmatimonadota bacterium]
MQPGMNLLDDALKGRIVDEARKILADLGVAVASPETVEMLHGHGAHVRPDGRLCIPGVLVDRALESAPPIVRLEGIGEHHRLELGDGRVHFTPGSAALSIVDWPSGEARTPTTGDYVRYARLVDGLTQIDSQSTALIPGDVPEAVSDSYRLYLSLLHGSKPVVTGTFSPAGYPVMRELLVTARGGAEALRRRPLAMFTVCPTSPLAWTREALDPFLRCVEDGVPVEVVAMPLAGFVAPVTLVGTVTQHTVEVLSGIVIGQLAAPGAPMVYGSAAAAFDVRFGSTPMGAVETMMLACAVSEIGRYLGLPTQAYIGLSDSKVLDAQAGWETGMGATLAALSGIHQCSGPGMLDLLSGQSLEKLVVDNEICGSVRRLRQGMEPREDFPLMPLMEEMLKEGHLLISDHSRRHLRAEHLMTHPVVDRLPRPRWTEDGSASLGERARRRVESLLAEHTAPPHEAGVPEALAEVMAAAARSAGMDALPEASVGL